MFSIAHWLLNIFKIRTVLVLSYFTTKHRDWEPLYFLSGCMNSWCYDAATPGNIVSTVWASTRHGNVFQLSISPVFIFLSWFLCSNFSKWLVYFEELHQHTFSFTQTSLSSVCFPAQCVSWVFSTFLYCCISLFRLLLVLSPQHIKVICSTQSYSCLWHLSLPLFFSVFLYTDLLLFLCCCSAASVTAVYLWMKCRYQCKAHLLVLSASSHSIFYLDLHVDQACGSK